MCSIEDRLEEQGKMPEFYKRYVNDTLSIMADTETAEKFLTTLNESHPSQSVSVFNRMPQVSTCITFSKSFFVLFIVLPFTIVSFLYLTYSYCLLCNFITHFTLGAYIFAYFFRFYVC